MLSYEKAKRLVEIFTDIPGVTASVGVEFEVPRGRTIGKIPDAPSVREIIIEYYLGDDKNREFENYILGLVISAYIESPLEGVEIIEYEIQTSIEETKDKIREEIFLKRASLMAQIAMKLKFIQRDSCGSK